MKKLLSIFLLLFTAAAFGQSDLPDKGTLADIKGKTKIYIAADTINSKALAKELGKHKSFTNAATAAGAEIFVEYKRIGDLKYVSGLQIPIETGQVDVYFYRDGKKVIVWSEAGSKDTKSPAGSLFKKFFKAIAKE